MCVSKKLAIVLKFAAAVICCVLAGTAAYPQQSAPRAGEGYTQGLLWRVERAGAPASHVFGTVHVADPRVTALAPEVRKSFDGASTFAMEVLFDPANVLQAAQRMLYLDGRELPGVIGAELWERTAPLASVVGLPPEALRRFKPWAVAMLLSVPRENPENILDVRLYRLALEQKKPVRELETVNEQIDTFEGLSESDQIALLRWAVANHETLRTSVQRIIEAYLRRDLAELSRVSQEDIARDPGMKRLHTTLMQRLLDDRNARMAERMEPQLKSGRAFIAVGALHLYGDRGVLARLAARGYRVSRVY